MIRRLGPGDNFFEAVPLILNDVVDAANSYLRLAGDGRRIVVEDHLYHKVIRFVDDTPVAGSAPADAAAAYAGYFAVVVELLDPAAEESASNPLVVKVRDGANPTSNIAGVSDLGNLAPVALEFAENGTVYLVATHNGSAYALAVGYELPAEGNYGYVELATISGGVVTQRWTGNVIYFAERYFVQL